MDKKLREISGFVVLESVMGSGEEDNGLYFSSRLYRIGLYKFEPMG